MVDAITIAARFNGPPGSANGGYTCGRVAALLGGGPAEVTLRSPPPLEQPLAVAREGAGVAVRAGETLVAEARSAPVELELPAPVGVEEARRASEAGYERWSEHHPFPTCVVCGPERADGDGMRVFPGELDGSGTFAAPWTPGESLSDGDGQVPPELVWAALDCPTSAPVVNFGQGPACVLARLAADLRAPVTVGEPHVLVSWPIEVDGRKRHAGAALLDAGGRPLARARALWIELRE